MEIEKMIADAENALENASISSENLIQAIVRLLEVAHANGLDADAEKALAECGITLKFEEE